ncbi:unnamed protein product [Caenorhabditis angaria]|uniref:Uncharacterized protein n=1 Tax=Caenorhabditis angaria TaxID=860376 RepID=A0A9P1IXB5_9PELO|nr:unnamed protein product [Caenorhabditis angaria]
MPKRSKQSQDDLEDGEIRSENENRKDLKKRKEVILSKKVPKIDKKKGSRKAKKSKEAVVFEYFPVLHESIDILLDLPVFVETLRTDILPDRKI